MLYYKRFNQRTTDMEDFFLRVRRFLRFFVKIKFKSGLVTVNTFIMRHIVRFI